MLDPKEERKYKRLRKRAQELHLPIPEAFWTLEVFKDGKLLQRHHQRSHSWTRNAYNCLFCQLAGKDSDDATYGAGKLNLKDTGGTVRYGSVPASITTGQYTVDADIYGYRAPASDDDHGILLGQGTDVEDFENFRLQTPIAEGMGAGQLNHVESQPHAISYAAFTLTNTLIRYFNNNTVGETSVDVNEVALVARGCAKPAIASYNVISRDKLASTVTVPSTGQLKVTYTIRLTYPA
ncbi:hypothetical protein ES708_05162 [subsurface metagenome]